MPRPPCNSKVASRFVSAVREGHRGGLQLRIVGSERLLRRIAAHDLDLSGGDRRSGGRCIPLQRRVQGPLPTQPPTLDGGIIFRGRRQLRAEAPPARADLAARYWSYLICESSDCDVKAPSRVVTLCVRGRVLLHRVVELIARCVLAMLGAQKGCSRKRSLAVPVALATLMPVQSVGIGLLPCAE